MGQERGIGGDTRSYRSRTWRTDICGRILSPTLLDMAHDDDIMPVRSSM